MSAKDLVKKPDLSGPKATATTLIIGLSCKNLRGFVYMWTNIFSFILSTKNADGCLQTLNGISSPFKILLVSYWQSPEQITRFVRSKEHVSWMQFIYRHPTSLNLFNETYGAPVRANYINAVAGYAATVDGGEQV